MTGVKEIEELVEKAIMIIGVAQRAGPGSWTITGNTMTINNQALADALRTVLEGVDQVELEKEVKDLSTFEVLGLARRSLSALQKILGN